MASGQIIKTGLNFLQQLALDDQTTAFDGVWLDCREYTTAQVHIENSAAGNCVLNGYWGHEAPANTSHGVQIENFVGPTSEQRRFPELEQTKLGTNPLYAGLPPFLKLRRSVGGNAAIGVITLRK